MNIEEFEEKYKGWLVDGKVIKTNCY